MVNKGVAYLLWCAGLFGFCGIHHFYLGNYFIGIIYFCTFGLLFIGQFIDLFQISRMVEKKNQRYKEPHKTKLQTQRLDVQILTICHEQGGATISNCVIETGAEPVKVKATINRLYKDGFLTVENRKIDGAVVYKAI